MASFCKMSIAISDLSSTRPRITDLWIDEIGSCQHIPMIGSRQVFEKVGSLSMCHFFTTQNTRTLARNGHSLILDLS